MQFVISMDCGRIMQIMKNMGGGLLIHARNAFNEGNMKQIVWAARHIWSTGARFLFNMYRHNAVLVIRGDKGVFIVKKVLRSVAL